ncbi:hypothetical protein MTR67_024274 [Solanum verrucosum]|uniref:Tf2-1-like SH3-like domain-containing protein n=1 Tax=Solanum verrucosum TaxID=315347 RepID=A0AAF0R3H6_SOLVR|nr:hypothetical protein MTR67_024274 [Solanum verrucosum]
MKGVMRFRKKGKLSPRYIGPYRLVKKIGNVVYELELPQELAAMHPNARRLTTDSGVLSWINDVQDADPGYLYLHHKTMQANWHQYMECTSMRAGKLSNIG